MNKEQIDRVRVNSDAFLKSMDGLSYEEVYHTVQWIRQSIARKEGHLLMPNSYEQMLKDNIFRYSI